MQKSIKIFYADDFEKFVQLSYDIELDEDIQVIHCSIAADNKAVPYWLHPRKFDFRSQFTNGAYTPLFNDNENINNINSVLFIEKAYTEIMRNEKFKTLN
jgi:hypothetical protein